MNDYPGRIKVLASVSAGAVLATIVSMWGGTMDNLGMGTWRNAVLTLSIPVLLVTVTWLLIALTRLATPQGSITGWKRVGKFTLIAWVSALVCYLVMRLGTPGVSAGAYSLWFGLLPSMVLFPTWMIVAFMRGRAISQSSTTSPTMDSPWEPGVRFTPSSGASIPWSARQYVATTDAGRRARIAIVVGSSVVALALVWVADQWVRSSEIRALMDTAQSTESAMWRFISQSDRAFRAIEGDLSTLGREGAAGKFLAARQRAGQSLATDLKVGRSDWDKVSLLPWHSDFAEFKDDYAKHLDAWISEGDYYATIPDAAKAFAGSPYGSDIEATFRVAGDTARGMDFPMFAGNTRERFIKLFED